MWQEPRTVLQRRMHWAMDPSYAKYADAENDLPVRLNRVVSCQSEPVNSWIQRGIEWDLMFH